MTEALTGQGGPPGWRAAAGPAVGVAGAALAAVAGWSSPLLLVGERVVPGWAVSAVLLAVALVLRGALRRAGRRRPAGTATLPGRWAGWIRWSGLLLIAVAALGTTLGAADDLVSSAKYHVLRPVGPGGCTAVVRETSFLVIGTGEAYAVGRTGVALGRAGSWTVDDGYRPFDAGTYTLRWGPDGTGLLQISGRPTDPVLGGGLVDVDCG
ncbi:hypothetical protein [Streptomyces humi]|uniref:hypothetical protein n=1 Tax=Streptomyces humi TaxID=1428620 RepID=UPI0011601CC0|nr:hypothetical protein [Streptomyces humi]